MEMLEDMVDKPKARKMKVKTMRDRNHRLLVLRFFSQKSIQNDSTHPQHDMMIHRMIYNLYQLMITEDHYIAHIF